jgi:para-aminobenzoate synthetase/4-amino-4-deoxychorismate lyase
MKNKSNEILLKFDFKNHNLHNNLQFSNPVEVITAHSIEEVKPAIEKVQQAAKSGLYTAGYISYEAAPAFDPAYPVNAGAKMPLLWFGLFEKPDQEPCISTQNHNRYDVSEWEPNTSHSDYQNSISLIKNAISQGDTYQVNYTIRLQAKFSGDDLAYYDDLSDRQRADYGAYLNLGRFRILSASPELFFHWDGTTITTRPMKGTIQRGTTLSEDIGNASKLAHSTKDQAENLMIVDLLRNDLGRVAQLGSVEVPRLFHVEKYPTVFQMTSTVSAKTRSDTTLTDIITALFPCGSITGAPKVNTMKIISEIEASPREAYCGTIGVIYPDGTAVFNVAIRTVVIDSHTGNAEYGVGGGITWDSTTEGEYAETVTKALFLKNKTVPFDLLETILLEDGEYALLDRHVNRLESSANYFDIPFSKAETETKLTQYAKQIPNERKRVRLLVSQNGDIQLESMSIEETPSKPLPVGLARRPLSRHNRFLYHKTTYRSFYNKIRNEMKDDLFDVLLWNEDRELTEFTIGNLVIKIDDEYLTPPIECGLLPGTFREELIEAGKVKERILTLQDLEICSGIWLINSLRGWVSVFLV